MTNSTFTAFGSRLEDEERSPYVCMTNPELAYGDTGLKIPNCFQDRKLVVRHDTSGIVNENPVLRTKYVEILLSKGINSISPLFAGSYLASRTLPSEAPYGNPIDATYEQMNVVFTLKFRGNDFKKLNKILEISPDFYEINFHFSVIDQQNNSTCSIIFELFNSDLKLLQRFMNLEIYSPQKKLYRLTKLCHGDIQRDYSPIHNALIFTCLVHNRSFIKRAQELFIESRKANASLCPTSFPTLNMSFLFDVPYERFKNVQKTVASCILVSPDFTFATYLHIRRLNIAEKKTQEIKKTYTNFKIPKNYMKKPRKQIYYTIKTLKSQVPEPIDQYNPQ